MSDEYDPDRMTFEDLDISDLDAARAYLDHPNTIALHDDLGRAFRALPPAQQIAELLRMKTNDSADRLELAHVLEDLKPARGDPRWELLRALDQKIEACSRRVEVLQSGG